jgi:H+-translocating NAD(P) transhydrogenase subunit alpha
LHTPFREGDVPHLVIIGERPPAVNRDLGIAGQRDSVTRVSDKPGAPATGGDVAREVERRSTTTVDSRRSRSGLVAELQRPPEVATVRADPVRRPASPSTEHSLDRTGSYPVTHLLLLLAEAPVAAEGTVPPAAAPVGTAVLLLTVFLLAVFVGFEIITKIPPTLHTPLMSGSNAISGITLIGALVAAGSGASTPARLLGVLAVILATMNVVGGFLVTHRMLGMFRRKR